MICPNLVQEGKETLQCGRWSVYQFSPNLEEQDWWWCPYGMGIGGVRRVVSEYLQVVYKMP